MLGEQHQRPHVGDAYRRDFGTKRIEAPHELGAECLPVERDRRIDIVDTDVQVDELARSAVLSAVTRGDRTKERGASHATSAPEPFG